MDNPSVDTAFVAPQESISGSRSRRTILIIILILIAIFFLIFLIWKLGQKPVLKVFPSKSNSLKQEAKLNIVSFMNNNLQSKYFPGNLPSSGGVQITDANNYYSIWRLNDLSLMATIQYIDKKQIDNRRVSFTIPVITQSLTTASAQNLITTYIAKTPSGTWKCSSITPDNKTILCENFWVDSNGTKNGIGIINIDPILANEKKLNTIIFTCSLYPGGKSYSDNSCSVYKK